MRRATISLVLLAAGVEVRAQSTCPLLAGQVSVRKAFDGTKAEQSPATIFWAKDTTAGNGYALIDAGVKAGACELNFWSGSQVVLFPAVEYHQSGATKKPLQTGSFAGKLEFRPVGLVAPGAPAVPGYFWDVAPVLVGSAKVTRDFRKAQTGEALTASLTAVSNYTGWPGSDFRTGITYRGRYYPYIIAEHYRSGPMGKDTTGSFLGARIWAEAWPISDATRQYVQLVGDWTVRRRVSGNLPSDHPRDLTLSANLYLDPAAHVGLGLDYSRGQDATQGFLWRQRTNVGAKIKF